MVGIRREKRIGGFFNKPVKERTPIPKTTLSRQVKKTEKTNQNLTTRQPPNYDVFENLDRRIGELKKTYRQYNHDEQELEQNLKQLTDRSKKLVLRLTHLLEAYNQAIVSLRSFDHTFKTNYLMAIETLLQRRKYRLRTYGITVHPDNSIDFDAELFLNKVMQDNTIFPYLFSNKHGFFIKLCDIFRHITIPAHQPTTYTNTDIQGSILDEHI